MLRKITYNNLRILNKLINNAPVVGEHTLARIVEEVLEKTESNLYTDEDKPLTLKEKELVIDAQIEEILEVINAESKDQTADQAKLLSYIKEINFAKGDMFLNIESFFKVIKMLLPKMPMLEVILTNTMLHKLVGLGAFTYLFTITSGLTSVLALSAHAAGMVGMMFLATQLLKSHLQATFENHKNSGGFFNGVFLWLKSFLYDSWFTAFQNGQLVIQDDAPTNMSFIERLKYLTVASEKEANNWTSKIGLASIPISMGLIIANTIFGMPLHLFVVPCTIAVSVMYDLFLPPVARGKRVSEADPYTKDKSKDEDFWQKLGTRPELSSMFLRPNARETISQKVKYLEQKKDAVSEAIDFVHNKLK